MAEIDGEFVEAVGGVLSAAHRAQLGGIARAAAEAHTACEQTFAQASPEGVLGQVAFDLAERMRYLALHPITACMLGSVSCYMSVASSYPSYVRTPLLLQGSVESVNMDEFDSASGRMIFGGDAKLVTGYAFQTRLHPNPKDPQSLEVDRVVVDQTSGASQYAGGYHILFGVGADRVPRKAYIMGGEFTTYFMEAAMRQDEKYREERRQAGQPIIPRPLDGRNRTYYSADDLQVSSLKQRNHLRALDMTARVEFPDEFYIEPTGILSLARKALRLDRFLRKK